MPGGTTAVRLLLAGLLVLLAAIGYFPFRWDPPRVVRNQVTRTADGFLRFGQMNDARTRGTPPWLGQVRASGSIEVRLKFNPRSLQQASMMMLGSNQWDTDFAIGQGNSNLPVWLRRPGSDAVGDPPFAIGCGLQPGRWASVGVLVDRESIRIRANDRTWLATHIPAECPWAGDQVRWHWAMRWAEAAGPWQGTIRHAQVSTPGYAVDYVNPGALSILGHYLYFPNHIEPFLPIDWADWLTSPRNWWCSSQSASLSSGPAGRRFAPSRPQCSPPGSRCCWRLAGSSSTGGTSRWPTS